MKTLTIIISIVFASLAQARDYHVAIQGSDTDSGTKKAPFRTIQHAADLAQPGDTITVHEGVYRERINPPRGGTADTKPIVYQAAPGEKVVITGAEPLKGWVKVTNDTWQVTIPNAFFGKFNPYRDLIRGDWFNSKKREHHTGAVYLNGDWLIEATALEEVLMPGSPAWLTQSKRDVLMNVAWLQIGKGATAGQRIAATSFAGKSGTTNAPCAEGGDCLGWVMQGNWVRYEQVDFGTRTDVMEIRAASASEGGLIELRLNTPEGELLGTCPVTDTGGWQSWVSHTTPIKPVSGVKTLCLAFKSAKPSALNSQLWFASVDDTNTTIWAQFQGVNPNEQLVEINVRQTVFYPDQPGRNYITVRGFSLRQAATPWAPPTAEQIGLIGTHWSKGWVIESNAVSHSICSGIALGKHGDQFDNTSFDNTSASSAEGYVKTIKRALAHPISWTKENIGSHLVRHNTISHCEQTGIVGSLGCSFSTVTDNVIHDIHVRELFSGAEMAGIKFHGAIDTTISRNHIYRTARGIWLDWMTQGTRVSGNLLHDNARDDLFLEVNHGPCVVDHNIFLSRVNVQDVSEGSAFAHNLFAGKMKVHPERSRATPFHPPHSTAIAGLLTTLGGDDRFYNNIFVGNGTAGAESDESAKVVPKHAPRGAGYGLWAYDQQTAPLQTGGNVLFHGAKPYVHETNALLLADRNPGLTLIQRDGRFLLRADFGAELKQARTVPVTTALLGKAKISNAAYVNPDGSPLKLDTDYFGKKHAGEKPLAGPFAAAMDGRREIEVWPMGLRPGPAH
jgi:hypothetical protein